MSTAVSAVPIEVEEKAVSAVPIEVEKKATSVVVEPYHNVTNFTHVHHITSNPNKFGSCDVKEYVFFTYKCWRTFFLSFRRDAKIDCGYVRNQCL